MSEMATIRYIWKSAKNFRAGRRRKLASIIIHSTEGHLAGDLPTLIGGDSRKISVHWYVTRSGTIYHMVADADTAFHAGNTVSAQYSNDASIGIEQEHISGKDDWGDLQLRTVASLVAFLRQKHGSLEIVSHAKAAAPPGRKTDPIAYPWDKFHVLVLDALKLSWAAEQMEP